MIGLSRKPDAIERLAAIDSKRAELSTAIGRAEAEGREISEALSGQVDAEAVADAVLAGASAGGEAASVDQLRARQETISAALGVLRQRLRSLDAERAEVQREIAAAAAAACDPLVADLDERANAAVQELLAVLADTTAIHKATSSSAALSLTSKVLPAAEKLAFAFGLSPGFAVAARGDGVSEKARRRLGALSDQIRHAGNRAP